MSDLFYTAIENAARATGSRRPLAEYRLKCHLERHHDAGYGLETAANPFYGRTQLPRDVVSDLLIIFERHGLNGELLDRLDCTDAGCAATILARLFDKSQGPPVELIAAALDEIEASEMAVAA